MMKELGKDEKFEKVKVEYEKLYGVVKKCYESEGRLVNRWMVWGVVVMVWGWWCGVVVW